MNIEDVFVPPAPHETEKWQLGSMRTEEIPENGIALIFCSDFRGAARGSAEISNYREVRRQLYALSKLDFYLPVCDLGDLISGKTHEDTHYILQEVLSLCFYKNTVPVVIGGSNDLSLALFSALNFHRKNITYTQVSNTVSLFADTGTVTENTFLTRILSAKQFTLKNYHHLAYQKHLNETDSIRLMKEVDFDVVRLAEMMNTTERTEPYFRRADLVTFNCDAVESRGEGFSRNPQVNGLNSREICAYMKEAGLSENLACAGIFNFNIDSPNLHDHQLLAQMIWYLLEGINIKNSHPTERSYETFYVLIGEDQYAFKRDTFTGLWYFGDADDVQDLLPCAATDYEAAKRGQLNPRFLKN